LQALVATFIESCDMFECAATLPGSAGEMMLVRPVQQLRATAVMVGAQQVAALCYQVEAADRSGDTLQVSEFSAALLSAIAAAKDALARITWVTEST
jgi:HPt (histidine-containing phosphotransfer) domain-containing protein